MNHSIRLLAVVCLGLFGLNPLAQAADPIDLSLLVAEDYPCTWPSGFPMFQLKHYRRIGSLTPYNIDVLTIDGNTGTQIDVPPHSNPGTSAATCISKSECSSSSCGVVSLVPWSSSILSGTSLVVETDPDVIGMSR